MDFDMQEKCQKLTMQILCQNDMAWILICKKNAKMTWHEICNRFCANFTGHP